VAKDRGIVVSESRQEQSPVYDSLMRITVVTEKGKGAFAGTVIGGVPRIVEVNGMELDAAFSPSMLYVNNLDKPGFIGALGMLLGETGVNIATFNLGRVGAGDGPGRRRRRRHRPGRRRPGPGRDPAGEDPRPSPRQGRPRAGVLI